MPTQTHTSSLHPQAVHDAATALFAAMGTPTRAEYSHTDVDVPGSETCHPVFGLASHFRGNDLGERGYTANPYRGDHMSIPCFTEDGEVLVLETSFHKGNATVDRVTFPDAQAGIVEALHGLLDACETR